MTENVIMANIRDMELNVARQISRLVWLELGLICPRLRQNMMILRILPRRPKVPMKRTKTPSITNEHDGILD